MNENAIVIYRTEDGLTEIAFRTMDGTVWLTQLQIAELFMTTKQNVSLHLKNIFENNELGKDSVVKESLTTAADGKPYLTQLYGLEAILAVGFRVHSPRGTQFRQWAATTLREYLVKGFVMNDERLKSPGHDYFDELLERIRDIRASEKLFYQKVKEIYSASEDYDPKSEAAQVFFKTVQNKMLYGVTGMTAAELVAARGDVARPNMGLTAWDGAKSGRGVRKGDVTTAKNYLGAEELRELNRIVTMFLDVAEDTALQRKVMRMRDWEARLDEFLRFGGRNVLKGAGKVSHGAAEQIAFDRYAAFNSARHAEETAVAELEAAVEFSALAKQTEAKRPRGKSSKGGKT